MRTRSSCRWFTGVVAAVVAVAWLLADAPRPLYAQTKRDKEAGDKDQAKGLSLKEARKMAMDNNYDLLQAKKQLVEKGITRVQYDARVTRMMADVERAYMGLYVARVELKLGQERAARGQAVRLSGRKGLKEASLFPVSPEAAAQDKDIAQAKQLAAFIPLEQQVKLQELNLKALLNSKLYSLRSNTEIVPTDRPMAMKKEIDEEALIEKALEHADRQSGPTPARARGPRADRQAPVSDFDNQKKRIILSVKRAVLKAQASVQRLEIARQVKEVLQKRLDALVTAKAEAAEIAAAQDAVEDAGVKEMRAILDNNDALMDLAELTGTLQKDLNVESAD